MASAQVLPNLRKQEHLEAGKRRLEEFRKKKAAERAKKTASTNQPNTVDSSLQEKQHVEAEQVRRTHSNVAASSNEPDGDVNHLSGANINNDSKADEYMERNEHITLSDMHANNPFSKNEYSSLSKAPVQRYSNDQEISRPNDSASFIPENFSNSQEIKDRNNFFSIYTGEQGSIPYGSAADHHVDIISQASQHHDSNYSQSILHGVNGSYLKENNGPLTASTISSRGSFHDSVTEVLPSTVLQSKSSNTNTLDDGYTSTLKDSYQPVTGFRSSSFQAEESMYGNAKFTQSRISDLVEQKLSSSASSLPSVDRVFEQTSSSPGLNFDAGSFSNQSSLYSGRNETTRRSRPSFLDSINLPKTEPEKANSPQIKNIHFLGSSAFPNSSTEAASKGIFSKFTTPNATSPFEQFGNSLAFSANGGDLLKSSNNESTMERKNEFYSAKQNEDFAALEQHIEDLTQEKFSLQRALEASQTLSESLATENSSLTDSYNQQRSVVNQLRSEMENLQGEITAQLEELDAVKNEYAIIRLECNAADERANILASEVIGLEEKALRLRSNELKLARQMENSEAEISSFKKKVSSLEKDRQDLQSTISALQEEKKLLLTKIRKASSVGGNSVIVSKSATNQKDVSTSTEDLENQDTSADTSNQELYNNGSLLGSEASNIQLLPESGQLGVSSLNIPSDQMRIIQNINSLISELTVEKQELTQALSSELSQSSKLKELNKELSRKLEAQTQRLELLTAQNMASENVSVRQPDALMVHENTPYADEGDEVVERVLGWIMKLFPGGPSKRRTSKLL